MESIDPAKLKLIRLIIQIKVFIFLLLPFAGFTHPHIIRQIDTMGVSLRYWIRWAFEGSNSWKVFLPAVLNAGDHVGITGMEFPFTNLLYAPFFSLPIDWARIASAEFRLLLCLGLTYFHYDLWKKNNEPLFSLASKLLVIVGVSSLYIQRFMPDYKAFILVSIAIALSWKAFHPWKSFLFAALGLLIKPPVVVAFGIFFLDPKKNLRHLRWVLPAVVLTFLYYTLGLHWLKSYSDFPEYFATQIRNPLVTFSAIFTHPAGFIKTVYESVWAPFGLLFVFFFFILARFRQGLDLGPTKRLLIILLGQLLIVDILDGEHSFIHGYYYIGTSFVVCLIFAWMLTQIQSKKLWAFTMLIFFCFHFERTRLELAPLLQVFRGSSVYQQCRQLREQSKDFPWNQGYHFRSPENPFPELGLCFGETEGSSTARYGFFYKNQALPKECKAVKESQDFILVDCQETL